MSGDTIAAIGIGQPWAWALATGATRYDNRPEFGEHLGPLLLYAMPQTIRLEQSLRVLKSHGLEPPRTLPLGAILGVVEMVDCVRAAQADRVDGKPDPLARGPWCYVYERPRLLATPIPYAGRYGFFDVPRDLVSELFPFTTGSGSTGPGPTEADRQELLERAIAAAGGMLRPAASK